MEKTRTISLFGNELNVKNYICARNGGEYIKKPEKIKLQLTINPTSFCEARCPFCIAHSGRDDQQKLDLAKLEKCLRALKNEDIVRGISIMGGEPMADVGLFDEILNLIYDIWDFNFEVSVTTNGCGLSQLNRVKNFVHLDALHISRHHYDSGINKALFGGYNGIPTNDELKEYLSEIAYRDVFVFNCMLLKDYIGTTKEVHRFLEFCDRMDIPKASFITPIKINKFTENQGVSYEQVLLNTDERILFTQSFCDFDECHCRDGVYYADSGRLVEFYGRTSMQGECEYIRGFVYGSDNALRTGFNGQIIKGL